MYRLNKLIISTVFIILFFSCKAQNKDNLYIVFKKKSKEECNYSMYRDGTEKKKITFKFKKYNVLSKVNFEICNSTFQYDSTKRESQVIEKNEVSNFKIVEIDYINELYEKSFNDKPANNKNIFILEEINKSQYIQYPVKKINVFQYKN